MKIVVLKTYTDDTRIYWATLPALGHEVIPLQYDHLPHDRHHEVIAATSDLKPDLLIFIGAVEESHGRPILRVDSLQKLAAIAPMIHMCGDAGDKPWWPILEEYGRLKLFNAQVSIDGNLDSPIAEFQNGIVKLCPVDPDAFKNTKPWNEKDIFVGLTGGHGHGARGEMMTRMKALAYVKWLEYGVGYQELADFMGRCKIIVNCPMTGSAQSTHVKARVVETGWAGACLFEQKNDHTATWFTPGHEYVRYNDLDQLVNFLNQARNHDRFLECVARNLHTKIGKVHNPKVFWRDVFDLAGVRT